MLIGVMGKIGEGKTTAAEYLKEYYGFKILSFATPMKKAVSELFGIPLIKLNDPVEKKLIDPEWNMTRRKILQRFGTGCMRNKFGGDFWVKHMRRSIDEFNQEDIVIDDVRFVEEVIMVQKLNGHLLRVIRPYNPYDLGDQHISEIVPETKSTVNVINSGDVRKLHSRIEFALDQFRDGKSSIRFGPMDFPEYEYPPEYI